MGQPGATRGRGRPSTGAKEKILRAATDVLAERGVAGLGTKAVAQRAQVAESSIFYHFKDRLGLLQAIVSAGVPAFTDVVSADLGRLPLGEALARLLDGLETMYVAVVPVQAAVLSDPDLKDVFTRRAAEEGIGPHRALPPVIGYLESEVRAGRIRADLDLPALALTILAAAHQRALLRHLGTPAALLPSAGAVAGNLALTLATPARVEPPT
ncbi:helix-turn-helix domain-containing protein [Longispora sp. K20-0274]|uniref:TetR/AcrR family transcriptional regulator n=1 Tax=Longispora sp. K20-0274 TaxID=3088255 RepID=UPI00399A5BDF